MKLTNPEGAFLNILNKIRPWSPQQRALIVPFPAAQDLPERKSRATTGDGPIVAFFTEGSFYEQEKERMAHSAERIGLKVHATAVPSAGSWVLNAGLKPGFLLQERARLRGPMLYVDVDAVFHRNPWPELRKLECDLAVYYEADARLISATILINDTPGAVQLIERWREGCLAKPDVWDQVVLEEIIAEDAASAKPQFRVVKLPASFCWIFDRVENGAVDEVFIEQLQASREATKRKRWFGRIGKRLKRRRDRVEEIERVLNGDNWGTLRTSLQQDQT
ncbi:putative nucleotide-diphospho-sugar transferase [Rhizobium sp. ZPR3]|uniref:Nucleotide-diphospho-sugar transferase n=2 Tax=unclassified Rhizobium TaxID=2613769 RepID=A0AAU7SKP6_9HYPH